MKFTRKWRSRNTPTPLPGRPLAGPRDLTTFTQTENRERRRGHLQIHYGGDFNLGDEIEAVLAPVAQRSDTTPHMVRFLTTAVHTARLEVERLLVERDARRRISDLPFEKRKRGRDLIVAAWERPTSPAVDPTGAWADTLVEHLAPLTDQLADYLGRATPPGQTRGGISISERLEDILRELDRAVLSATRHLNARAAYQATASTPLNPRLRSLRATPAELDALGITP